ncbi:kinase-like protein [Calocera viscosa TUFC12733]|uniref:Kinase-like protein n=1 Tax=Calocera viscosa (strain TUFC12733) TaxID=1330018 RepID=A0A167P4G4_CALVF|nr:kinase-like protein [Calocera viscosa TUFC12733]
MQPMSRTQYSDPPRNTSARGSGQSIHRPHSSLGSPDDVEQTLRRPRSAMTLRQPSDQSSDLGTSASDPPNGKTRSASDKSGRPNRDEIFSTGSPGSAASTRTTNSGGQFEVLRRLIAAIHVKELQVERMGKMAVDGGAFGDVWKGHVLPSRQLVAIKVPRAVSNAHLAKLCKSLARELAAWALLQHENVLPLLGVVIPPDTPQMWLVSPWMENKNLLVYMKSHPEVDPLHILMGVGRGLAYVHSKNIVHGDLKANNVLVDDNGEPQLMDFGLSFDLEEPTLQTTSAMFLGNVRWLAPERLDPDRFGLKPSQSSSPASDVYALGMLIYEVFTGQMPFYEIKNPLVLVGRIKNREKPTHPGDLARPGLTRRLWGFVDRCWEHDRSVRPAAEALEPVLQHASSELSGVIRHYRGMTERAVNAETALQAVKLDLSHAQDEQSKLRLLLDDATENHEAALASLQKMESELDKKSLQIEDMKANESKLRALLETERQNRVRFSTLAERGSRQQSELDEARAALKATQEQLQANRQELEAHRSGPKNAEQQKVHSVGSPREQSADFSRVKYLIKISELNKSICNFSDALQNMVNMVNIRSGVIQGTICGSLCRHATSTYLLGLEDQAQAVLEEIQERIEDFEARRQWTLVTRRSLKAGQTTEDRDVITRELEELVLDDLESTASPTAPFLQRENRLHELMRAICENYVDLVGNLLCDSDRFRLTYFTVETEFDNDRMACTVRSVQKTKVVAWTEQFGFETDLGKVHLKAIVKCY